MASSGVAPVPAESKLDCGFLQYSLGNFIMTKNGQYLMERGPLLKEASHSPKPEFPAN